VNSKSNNNEVGAIVTIWKTLLYSLVYKSIQSEVHPAGQNWRESPWRIVLVVVHRASSSHLQKKGR